MAPVVIRAAGPADRDALYEICRLTGDAGEDASDLYADPDLLGELWVGPYLALEPELAFVAADERGPVGYVLGAADTAAFESACEEVWWPERRERHPEPPATRAEVLAEYPAHLHINLHPRAQGQGFGRRLIDTLFGALRARDVTGVHLGVAAANRRAIGFYTHLGFQPLGLDGAGGLLYGRRLQERAPMGRDVAHQFRRFAR